MLFSACVLFKQRSATWCINTPPTKRGRKKKKHTKPLCGATVSATKRERNTAAEKQNNEHKQSRVVK